MDLSKRHAALVAFVLEQLPRRGRVLEIGCGRGEVALALAAAGFDVTAIDPQAPDGPIFRRARLEDYDGDGGFDAVVASVSLHHVSDLDAAVERIEGLLAPGGFAIVEEFASERLVGATARWYHAERRARDETIPADGEAWLREWRQRHADIHPGEDVRRALDRRLAERLFEWTPYLYSHALDDAVEPLERRLIAAGEIEPTGFRYVGERRV